MKKLILAVSLIVLSTVSCFGNLPSNNSKPDTASLQEVFGLINEARAHTRQCGSKSFPPAPALSYNRLLAIAAQNHSEDMAASKTVSHETPENAIHYPKGSKTIERIRHEGYQPAIVMENIAGGQSTAKQVVGEWLASPSHCSSIMSPRVSETGLGRSGNYWTQVFAEPY